MFNWRNFIVKYPPTKVGGLLKPLHSRLFVFLGLWLVTLPTYPRGAQAAHDAEPQTLFSLRSIRKLFERTNVFELQRIF